jgi:hypothetical protein
VTPDNPVSYVLSLNLHRRHLTPSQASMCAARAREIYEREAKERQGKRTDLDIPANLPECKKGDARDIAGKAFGVSGKSVDHATRVIEKGIPELAKAVDVQPLVFVDLPAIVKASGCCNSFLGARLARCSDHSFAPGRMPMIAFCEPAEDPEREARSDRRQRLLEVASMMDEFGLTLAEAEELVCVDVGGDRLPAQRIFCPPPDWLAELCAEVRESWTPEETNRRIVGDKSDTWDIQDIDTRELVW